MFVTKDTLHYKSPWKGEVNNEPSMCEPVYNPSIADMLYNPQLMIQHFKPMFDDGEDISDVPSSWENDIQSIDLEEINSNGISRRQVSEEAHDERGTIEDKATEESSGVTDSE